MARSRLSTALETSTLSLPEDGVIAVLRARSDQDYADLGTHRLHLFNTFRPTHDALTGRGATVGTHPQGQAVAALVEITRSRIETLGLIAQAFKMVQPGGLILVDGAKTDGIESILKFCRAMGAIEETISKAHGKLFWIKRPEVLPSEIADWQAQAGFSRNSDGFITAPGMFSPEKIDIGSAMLAAHFDHRLAGHVADLGAGWGWLSLQALARGDIQTLDLYEAELLALEAAEKNIADDRAAFHWADVTEMTPKASVDHVICNPPFHQGRAAEPGLGLAFIDAAAGLLKPRGHFWMVANRQLPYEARLAERFAQVTSLEETPHFKVFLATRPRTSPSRSGRLNTVGSRQRR